MSEPQDLNPETEDRLLQEVDDLGGDADVLASLPDEGVPAAETPDEPEAADVSGDEDALALDELDDPFLDDDYPPEDEPEADEDVEKDTFALEDKGSLFLTFDADSEDEESQVSTEPESEAQPEAEPEAVVEIEAETPSEPESEAQIEDEPATSVELPPLDTFVGMLDIDTALASVASLSDIVMEREAEAHAEVEERFEREPPPVHMKSAVASPPPLTLKRGQPGSVIPALALMGVGAWLTFVLTTGTTFDPTLVLGAVGGVVILMLLAQWIGSGRWSRGVFFFTILALLVAGALYYDIAVGAQMTLAAPLALGGVGVAFALTGLLARPADRRLLLPGMMFIVAGAVVFASGLMISTAGFQRIAPYWWVVVVALVIIWLLPVVFKRRS